MGLLKSGMHSQGWAFLLLLTALLTAIVVLAASPAYAKCCILNDTHTSFYYNADDDCEENEFEFNVSCEDTGISVYTTPVCCNVTISSGNTRSSECYYLPPYFVGLIEEEKSGGLVTISTICNESISEENCINGQQGSCVPGNEISKCTPGCLNSGESPLFCTEEGRIISNCSYCNGCGSFYCDGSTGMCVSGEIFNCTSNGKSCCEKCASGSQQHHEFSCPSGQVCCDSCETGGGITPPPPTAGEKFFYGYVKNSTGGAIEGAVVVLENSGIGATTNSDGYYEIQNSTNYLSPGRIYALMAYKAGYLVASFSNKKGPAEVNITLSKAVGDPACVPSRLDLNISAKHHAQGSPAIELEWSSSCSEMLAGYMINRSNITAGRASFQKQFLIEPNSNAYVDSDGIRWNTTYNYTIVAIYNNGSISKPSSVRFTTGSQFCEGVSPGEEFCGELNRAGQLIAKNTPNAKMRYTCTSENIPTNRTVKINMSSNLYDFADCTSSGLNKVCALERREDGKVGTKCVRPDRCSASGNPLGLFYSRENCNSDECYYDYSNTTVDACYPCRADLRCSEFRSEDACLNNGCGLNCSWLYTIKELNLGICYSVPPTDDCERCNSIWGGCTPENCALLGSCRIENGQCTHCPSSINCTAYTTKEDCEGNSKNKNFEYCSEGQKSFRSSTTDSCGKLRCLWNGTACVKDGNFDGKNDCTDLSESHTNLCVQDNIPPETNIKSWAYNPENKILSLNITFSEGVKEFKYCIDTYECCPDKNETYDQPADKTLLEDSIGGGVGIYYIRYYALDIYNNQESLKTQKIVITGADQRMNPLLNYFFKPGDGYYNLSVFVQTAKPANCTFEINRDASKKIFSSTFGRVSQEFTVDFANLQYSSYLFILNCTSGNEKYQESYTLSYAPAKSFNITFVDGIYTGPNTVPILGRGTHTVWLNFSRPVSIDKLSYSTLDDSYNETISSYETSDNLNFRFNISIKPSPSAGGSQNALWRVRKDAILKIVAVPTDTSTDTLSLTEYDANQPYFKIFTRGARVINVTIID